MARQMRAACSAVPVTSFIAAVRLATLGPLPRQFEVAVDCLHLHASGLLQDLLAGGTDVVQVVEHLEMSFAVQFAIHGLESDGAVDVKCHKVPDHAASVHPLLMFGTLCCRIVCLQYDAVGGVSCSNAGLEGSA